MPPMSPDQRASILNAMSKHIKRGDVENAVKLLFSTIKPKVGETPTLEQKVEQSRLFYDCAARIDAGLEELKKKQYFWIITEFMSKPDILSVIIPYRVEETVSVFWDSAFPHLNDLNYRPEHRARNKSEGWQRRDTTQQLFRMAQSIRDQSDLKLKVAFENAFYKGFLALPDEVQEPAINTGLNIFARDEGVIPLLRILNEAHERLAPHEPQTPNPRTKPPSFKFNGYKNGD